MVYVPETAQYQGIWHNICASNQNRNIAASFSQADDRGESPTPAVLSHHPCGPRIVPVKGLMHLRELHLCGITTR